MEMTIISEQEKEKLRQSFLKKRNSMDTHEIKNYSRKICDRIIHSTLYQKSQKIFTFVSFGTEVDTTPLIIHALSNHKMVAVPKVFSKTRKMIFSRITDLNELGKGHFGILEPPSSLLREETSDEKTLFIVPGLIFDIEKYRIGYGGGYYDIYFKKNLSSAITIGVAYDFQVISKIPRESHDISLDWIVTEKR